MRFFPAQMARCLCSRSTRVQCRHHLVHAEASASFRLLRSTAHEAARRNRARLQRNMGRWLPPSCVSGRGPRLTRRRWKRSSTCPQVCPILFLYLLVLTACRRIVTATTTFRGVPPGGNQGADGEGIGLVDIPVANAGRSPAGLGDVQQTHWGISGRGAEDQDGKAYSGEPARERCIVERDVLCCTHIIPCPYLDSRCSCARIPCIYIRRRSVHFRVLRR